MENLKQKIRRGETLLGFGVPYDMVRDDFKRALELDIYDFAFTDSQHSPYSEDRLVAIAALAGEFDLPLQFRVKHTSHTYRIGTHLDLGPSGVEVPQVETVQTVDAAVANFYYLPQGKRSHGGRHRVGDASVELQAYADWWNEYGVLWIQIESVTAASNAFNLARPGVDCLSFGPSDLQMDINHRDHPHPQLKTVDDCVRHVVKELEGTKTAVCFRSGTAEHRQRYLDMGVRVILEAAAV